MSNKQKLPKHITAHVHLHYLATQGDVILLNNETMKCLTFNIEYGGDLLKLMVRDLNLGHGVPFADGWVGKQIVF